MAGVSIEADWEGESLGAFETGGESRVILVVMIVEAEIFVYRFLPWHNMEKSVENVEECVANFCGW